MEGGKKAREVKGLKEGGKGEEEREERDGRGSESPLGHLASVDRSPSPEEERTVQGHANPNSSFLPTSCHIGVGRRWGSKAMGKS